jgi:hypothetical protein
MLFEVGLPSFEERRDEPVQCADPSENQRHIVRLGNGDRHPEPATIAPAPDLMDIHHRLGTWNDPANWMRLTTSDVTDKVCSQMAGKHGDVRSSVS